jgi:hypothetical protein
MSTLLSRQFYTVNLLTVNVLAVDILAVDLLTVDIFDRKCFGSRPFDSQCFGSWPFDSRRFGSWFFDSRPFRSRPFIVAPFCGVFLFPFSQCPITKSSFLWQSVNDNEAAESLHSKPESGPARFIRMCQPSSPTNVAYTKLLQPKEYV